MAATHPPLKPDLFYILLALEEGERHGYGIIKEVERSTDGQIRLEPSPLYRRLKRLLDDGVVEESEKRPVPELDDERRRYYRLTACGRRLVTAEARRLVALAGSERVRALASAGPRTSDA
jgi:DNA-binding PadR family transcriptional regulator